MKTSLELRKEARAGTSKAFVLFVLDPCTWNSRVEGTGSRLLVREVPPCRCGKKAGREAGVINAGDEGVVGPREQRKRGWGRVCLPSRAPCWSPD